MKKQTLKYIITVGLFLPISLVSASTIVSPHKYAWSNQVGYINFENVVVDNRILSGYAWSANSGWIKFNPSNGGVLNDGNGDLSGYAWGENLGWIDFSNVSINQFTGKFSGTATGSLVGTINFDCPNYCDVETDWRVNPPVSGSKPVKLSIPIVPVSQSKVVEEVNNPPFTKIISTDNSSKKTFKATNLTAPSKKLSESSSITPKRLSVRENISNIVSSINVSLNYLYNNGLRFIWRIILCLFNYFILF